MGRSLYESLSEPQRACMTLTGMQALAQIMARIVCLNRVTHYCSHNSVTRGSNRDLAYNVEKNLDYYGVIAATSDFVDVAVVTRGLLYSL
jgi:hypothetical protein